MDQQRLGQTVTTPSIISVSDREAASTSYTDADRGSVHESAAGDNDEDASKLDALLDDDPFSSEASKRLFDAIDELRRCGVGQDLDLPQLVIVGKQSAGKSSLLESLTDIPFPIGDGLCTRFATRIISRRTAPGTANMVQVSIEPGDVDPFGYPENNSRTGSFNPTIPSLSAEVFADIVKQASNYMGILKRNGSGKKNFASEVLKIELSGPNRSHFGILDVPGVFSAKTRGISAEEMSGVTEMVASYMKKPENVIICIADATDDLNNQRIFELASDHGDIARTVGVFTKCDVTQHPEKIVKIVTENQDIPLEKGWFVVQNRGPKATNSFNREEEEMATFSRRPWTGIPIERRGTLMLKKFLANLLCRRIRENFPDMQRTIGRLLAAEKAYLMRLGEPRTLHHQQQTYLVSIAERFQTLAHQALTSPEELSSDAMKLRGMTQKSGDEFAEELRRHGHFYPFHEIGKSTSSTSLQNEIDLVFSLGSDSDVDDSNIPNRDPLTPDSTSVRLGTSQKPSSKKTSSLYDEIRIQMAMNRAEELPVMTNPKVLKPLFRKQASKWEGFGRAYLHRIVLMSSDVSIRILEEVCLEFGIPNHRKRELKDIILGFEDAGEKRILEKLRGFWQDTLAFPLQTNNELFVQKVKEAQHLRFRSALERYRKKKTTNDFIMSLGHHEHEIVIVKQILETRKEVLNSWTIVDSNDLNELFQQMHPRGVQNTEDEIHDLLKAYYEIAREDYVTHVAQRIVEPFLQEKQGPLLGLSTKFVLSLNEEEVERLGGEDESVTTSRKETTAKIARLEEGMRIADMALRQTNSIDA